MNVSKLVAGLCGCLLGGAALSGCVLEAGLSPSAPPPPDTGSITVRWTIAGTASPAQCAYYHADSLQLVVYDADGARVITTNAPCDAFNVTIDLEPGLYHADATLIDAEQRGRSLTLPINNLEVTAGTDIASETDFPARSFL